MLSILKKSLNVFKGLKNVGKFSFNDKSIRIYFHHYFVLHQTYLPVWFLEGNGLFALEMLLSLRSVRP